MSDILRSAWKEAAVSPLACIVLAFIAREEPWEASVKITGFRAENRI
jgi:hypothetical protein